MFTVIALVTVVLSALVVLAVVDRFRRNRYLRQGRDD
jgi:hypothetical protein